MDNEMHCLKSIFNGYSFTDLLNLCDATLHTEDGCTFKIHKIQLVKSSRYFYCLFCGDVGVNKNEFVIPGVSGKTLRTVLSYIYTEDSVHITEDNVCDVFIAADYLLLEDLIQYIKNVYAKNCLSIVNCLPLHLAAIKIDPNDNLCSKSYRCIQINFEAIVATDDKRIGELPLESLKHILSDKNLRVTSENTVWMAIAKWVQIDLNYRQSLVPELLMYLAVCDINEQTATNIVEHSLVKLNPFCEEINNLRLPNKSVSNLKILLRYFQQQPRPDSMSFDRRLPKHLHFILSKSSLYVTYDENFDLWRKIPISLPGSDSWFPSNIVLVGENIYLFLFGGITPEGDLVICYNIREEDYRRIPQFVQHPELRGYGVVQHRGLIFVIGGWDNSESKGVVEVYNPDECLWHQISPMLPLRYSIYAVTLGERIYVVGLSLDEYEVTMQAYYDEIDEWIVLTPPSLYREEYTVITYEERLFIIGGYGENSEEVLRTVEIFDPTQEEWTRLKDIPDVFLDENADFDAIVFDNKLIIYDNLDYEGQTSINSAVQWDEDLKNWIVIEETSFLTSLYKYRFFVHHNRGMSNMIVTKNKEPDTKFELSPFN